MSLPVSAVYNEDTDFEFSVSDTLANLISGGQFNENTLAEYCYTGFIDDMVGGVVQWEDIGAGSSNQYAKEHCGVYWNNDNKKPNHAIINYALANKGDVVYMRNILLYNSFLPGNEMDKSNARVVVDIHDIKKWYMNFDKGDGIQTTTLTSASTYSPDNAFTGTAYRYQSTTSWGATIVPDTVDPSGITYSLHPCNILIINNEVFIGFLNPSNNYRSSPSALAFTGYSQSWCQNNTYGKSDLWTWLKNDSYMYTTSENYYIGYPPVSTNYEFPDFETTDGARATYIECDNGNIARVGFRISDDYYLGTNASYDGTYAAKDKKTIRHWFSWCGLKFKSEGTMYKPIIEGGIITGYTSDMDIPSEFDDMTNVTGNDIPITPPSPPSPSGEDDIDSMGFDGMSCNVGGPAKYYIMSYSDIHHLIGDFNAHAEPGTSISNNIISCYVNALDWNWSTGSEPIEIYSGGAQTIAFTSDINYDVLTGYNARNIIGSIDVPRMTNTFYDFSPYSTYEVYIPFCGWVALPDTVAGRHIKIYFETDEATCGCKGRVFFVDDGGNGVTVAEITGSFGAPCPIQVIEGGLYKQAMLSNGLQVIGGIASGIMGGASGSGVFAVGGLSNAMQSLGNCLIAGNTNYGQTIGRAGDASGLMCAGKPYLKITYPPIDEVVNNSMFGHTVGYLCNSIGNLSNYHGFTVCGNPHVHISATSAEKEEIKQLLEQGVILP